MPHAARGLRPRLRRGCRALLALAFLMVTGPAAAKQEPEATGPVAASKPAAPKRPAAEDKPLGLSFGLTYWTDYYYRGQSFLYDADLKRSDGVLMPWINYSGLGWLNIYLGGELDLEAFGDDHTSTGKLWNGIDLIVTHDGKLGRWLTYGVGVAYFTYPRGYPPKGDLIDFAMISLKLGAAVLLSPTLTYEQHVWIDYGLAGADRLKDCYLSLSIGHAFTLAPSVSLKLGLKGSLWYLGIYGTDTFGFSDLLTTAELAVTLPRGFALSAGANLGLSPDRRFQWPEGDVVKLYLTFGLSYSM